jgi:hypothetical protein
MTTQIYAGNAVLDGAESRGWLLGHFQPADDARRSDDVVTKWAIHLRGEKPDSGMGWFGVGAESVAHAGFGDEVAGVGWFCLEFVP